MSQYLICPQLCLYCKVKYEASLFCLVYSSGKWLKDGEVEKLLQTITPDHRDGVQATARDVHQFSLNFCLVSLRTLILRFKQI
jgi:hypothetical protein